MKIKWTVPALLSLIVLTATHCSKSGSGGNPAVITPPASTVGLAYYVSGTSGADMNTGLSAINPLKSLSISAIVR